MKSKNSLDIVLEELEDKLTVLGSNEISSLENLPINFKTVKATLSSDSSLSLSKDLDSGGEIDVVIFATDTITIKVDPLIFEPLFSGEIKLHHSQVILLSIRAVPGSNPIVYIKADNFMLVNSVDTI